MVGTLPTPCVRTVEPVVFRMRSSTVVLEQERYRRAINHKRPPSQPIHHSPPQELCEANTALYESEQRLRARKSILCFDGEIRQVLSNLVGNAIDAMHPVGGRLLVRSREGRDWKTGRKRLVITVADTGQGMTKQSLLRAFEPFYTTKGIAGTGLGLWVTEQIVARHQGELRIRSSAREPRSGTILRLTLPHEAATR